MIQLILVGLGARAQYWLKVIERSDACRVVALCDPDPEARARAAKKLPGCPVFASLEAALQSIEADALLLATPPHTRAPHIKLACDHGLALLVEKPLSDTFEEAEQFVLEAERADVSLMVGLNFRYLNVTKATIEILKQNTVGTHAFGRFLYERYRDGQAPHLNKYPLTMRHPMLWEQSIHHFDLMRYVYSAEPVTVSCTTWNPSWSMYQHDANVSALFSFDNGVQVTYQGTWQSGWKRPNFSWRTDCSEGVILQEDQFGGLAYARREDEQLTEVPLEPHEIWITDTAGVLDAFVRHVRDGAPLECSGRDHLQSLRMVQGCILSAARQETLRFEDLREVVMN